MSRRKSPFIYGEYWLDKRRDGHSPETWQIARSERGTIIYKSTRTSDLEQAKAALEAFVALKEGKDLRSPEQAQVSVLLIQYWTEKGRHTINYDQTERSIRTFLGFLLQDPVGVRAVVTDLTPALFERFRSWRMGPHSFSFKWYGKEKGYRSAKGVSGATVQRNINDVRAAVRHAEANMRVSSVPRIRNVEKRYQSPHRDRILTDDELARIVWYSAHNKDLFRFVALMMGTGVRPGAALKFNPRTQYDDARKMIDLQPDASPQTKKRNAIVPAIRPMRVVLRAWAKDEPVVVESHKKAWRIMRRVLNLSADVQPKTIRYTIATWLYEMEWVPERQISELLGHVDSDSRGLARTSRIYAKYRPDKMGKVVEGLTIIWRRIFKMVRQFDAKHTLTSGQRGDCLRVLEAKPSLDLDLK